MLSRNALTSSVNGVEFVKTFLHTSAFKLCYLYIVISFFLHLIYISPYLSNFNNLVRFWTCKYDFRERLSKSPFLVNLEN